jgi:hypothetical protein
MWLYQNTEDNKARFILGEHGENPLICIGINPSTAKPEDLDNTLRNVKTISSNQGFDGWVMLNVYPQRATNPNHMSSILNEDYHRLNLEHIESIFRSRKSVVWAAWGTLIGKRPYLNDCLKDIVEVSKRYPVEWKIIGQRSKAGHPHHPLYLNHSLKLESFDIEGYLNR